MKTDHPLAANIFERLSRFTPRQGEKRKREPLEDYITEAIAFFLLCSEKFKNLFLTKVLSMSRKSGSVAVATQNIDEEFDGRADLVLEFQTEEPFRVGIEVKRFAGFQPNQLKRLKAGFPLGAYLLAPESYIDRHEALISAEGVRPAFLEDVHQICEEAGKDEDEPMQTLLRQFSEFLESKGHARVRFTQHPMKISSLSEAARMMDEWSIFLLKIRSELELERSGQWAVPHWDGPTPRWPDYSFYGVYGPDFFYAGFRVGKDNSVDCYYEESRPVQGDHAKLLPKMDKAEGRVYYHVTAPYPDVPVVELPVELIRIFRKLRNDLRATLDDWEK